MQDRIEKSIEVNAPLARVWRAISDHREFGEWFRVKLDQPFEVGAPSTGRITYPGYEHVKWNAEIVAVEPETRLALRWRPNADDPDKDYSKIPWILVEFLLEPTKTGTRVTVIESGFSKLPDDMREKTFRSNERGWEEQMRNIKAHVEG